MKIQLGEYYLLKIRRSIEGEYKMKVDPKLYQAALESRPLHVNKQYHIERYATVRVFLRGFPKGRDSIVERRQVRNVALSYEHLRMGQRTQIFRNLWVVLDSDSQRVFHWGSLAIAKAQRDGLNYHFARWLMTSKEVEK